MTRSRLAHKRIPATPHQRRPVSLWGKDTVVIERMSQEGRGIAYRHGKIVFVRGALTGEQVRVQCTAAVNTLLKALLEILFAAPELQGLRELEIDADSHNRLGLCFYFSANPGTRC